MPSPFPGMDPYLESPARWRGVHTDLISRLRATLNNQLPSGFVAEIDERLYVVSPGRNVYPDVAIVEEWSSSRRRKPRAGAAAMLESDPPLVIVLDPMEVREPFINIQRADDPGRVIATLEILSPTNKDPGGPGYALYREKQRQILESNTHLVEIDLLREGQHTVAAPKEVLDKREPWQYIVCLHRGGEAERFEIWPFTLRKRLPRFHVPLAGDANDEVINLQAVLQHCYDESRYDRLIDYREAPAIPLKGDDATWADALLREKGLRPRRRRPRRNGDRA